MGENQIKSQSPMKKGDCRKLKSIVWCKKQKNSGQKTNLTKQKSRQRMASKIIASPCGTRSMRRSSKKNLKEVTKKKLKKLYKTPSTGLIKISLLRKMNLKQNKRNSRASLIPS